jgi:hypothetical protein
MTKSPTSKSASEGACFPPWPLHLPEPADPSSSQLKIASHAAGNGLLNHVCRNDISLDNYRSLMKADRWFSDRGRRVHTMGDGGCFPIACMGVLGKQNVLPIKEEIGP